MDIASASIPGDGEAYEDRAISGADWAVVLDGAGPYSGFDYGCHHSASWLVDQLAAHLTEALAGCNELGLNDVLADAIQATRNAHGPQCDPDHPLALGATVAIVRQRRGVVEWLVLGDSTAVIEHADGEVIAVIDDRLDRLDGPVTDAEVRTFRPDYVATRKNKPGGFWVAGVIPEAAYHAYSGQALAEQVRQALLCTDGVSRLVDRYGWTWSELIRRTEQQGVPAVLNAVRAAEEADEQPRRWRGKRHDDATASLVRFKGV
jgi:serine/threonine protein phosphatase PrpC